MAVTVMTCTILWAAVTAAYLVYCINGDFTVEQKSLSAATLKSQAMSGHLRRHLHQQVHYYDNICGLSASHPALTPFFLCMRLNPQLLGVGIA